MIKDIKKLSDQEIKELKEKVASTIEIAQEEQTFLKEKDMYLMDRFMVNPHKLMDVKLKLTKFTELTETLTLLDTFLMHEINSRV